MVRCKTNVSRRVNLAKPRPEIDYDFVYFSINNELSKMWHGVTHTLNDVREAVNALVAKQGRQDSRFGEMQVSFVFLKFDKQHSIAPLLEFNEFDYWEHAEPTCINKLGGHYFGVKYALNPLNWQDYDSFWVCGLGTGERVPKIGYGFGNFLLWCNGLEPREHVNLLSFGIRKVGRSGHDCIIYYSPSWFRGGDGNSFMSDDVDDPKSWVIFGKSTRL